MSLEYVGLVSIYAFILWGLLVGVNPSQGPGDQSVVQNSFSSATPILGARVERNTAIGWGFSRADGSSYAWEDPN